MDNPTDTQVTNEGTEQTTEAHNDSETESVTKRQFTPYEKQLYNRVQRLEKDKEDLEGRLGVQPERPAQKQTPAFEERLELIARGYKDDEIDFIQKNGGKSALEDDFVVAALQAKKEKAAAEAKAVSGVSTKSGVSRQYTPSQIAQMSSKEYQEKILKS